ncbi:unnamed protein product [Pylaiella littoralis]
MRECEEQGHYARSTALAVFHGDLRAAVSALRRAHDVTNQELQAVSTVVALMPPIKAAAAASHAQVMEARRSMCLLLDMMSMFIAGFHPPAGRAAGGAGGEPGGVGQAGGYGDSGGGGGNREEEEEEEDDQPLWKEKLKELLESKELRGTSPTAAYLRACCLFLRCVPEVVSSQARRNNSGGGRGASGNPASEVLDAGEEIATCNTRRSYTDSLAEPSWASPPSRTNATSTSSRGGSSAARGAATRAWRSSLQRAGAGAVMPSPSATEVGSRGRSRGGAAWGLSFRAVLEDRALALEDRTALALMFLPTTQLQTFLTFEEGLYTDKGVLDGVLLTGMAHRGLSLMQNYIDRTMDVQTAALVATRSSPFFPPGWRKEKETVHVWGTEYRHLLMRWQYWFNFGLFAKYCQRAKTRLRDNPLSPEAVARLEAIRVRSTPPLPSSETPPAGISSATAAAGAQASPSATPLPAASITTAAAVSPAFPGAPLGTSASRGDAVSALSGSSIAGASAARSGRASGGGGGGGRSTPYDVTEEIWYGFGGKELKPNFLRIKCNFCQTPVGIDDSPAGEAKSGAGYSRQGRAGERGESARRTPIVSYCSSCRNPLPRCFICLQQIGALNPEIEARRREFDQLKGGRGARLRGKLGGGGGGGGGGEGATMADGGRGGAGGVHRKGEATQSVLDIWWSWCSVCNHGGHNGHLENWFEEHDTCGTQGCSCRCASLDLPIVS